MVVNSRYVIVKYILETMDIHVGSVQAVLTDILEMFARWVPQMLN